MIEKIVKSCEQKFYDKKEFFLVFDSAYLNPRKLGLGETLYPIKHTIVNRMNLNVVEPFIDEIIEFLVKKLIKKITFLEKISKISKDITIQTLSFNQIIDLLHTLVPLIHF